MSAEIIDIKLGNNSPPSSPKLSVVGNGDEGLIKLNEKSINILNSGALSKIAAHG